MLLLGIGASILTPSSVWLPKALVATGSAAKKVGKRRISFRQRADADEDAEGSQAGSEQDEIEQQEADEPLGSALSADCIEEDERPAAAAPSSSE